MEEKSHRRPGYPVWALQNPPHMLFYSEVNGAGHNKGYTYRLVQYEDEVGRYYGLPNPPQPGWDEDRQPFVGADYDWEQSRENGRRANKSRKEHSMEELVSCNKPWRTPEGDCTFTVKEMDQHRKDILNGTHYIAEINKSFFCFS